MKRLNKSLILSVILLIGFIISGIEVSAKTPSLTIIPKTAFIEVGKTKKFKATRNGRVIKNVTWFVKVDEELGNGDGSTTSFALANKNIEENSETITVDGIEKVRDIDYSIDYTEGTIEFFNPPDADLAITASYFIQGGNDTLGTIDGNGLYTAPSILPEGQNPINVEIKAVSNINPEVSGKATLKVFSPPVILSLQITPKQTTVALNGKITFSRIIKKRGIVDQSVKWYVNDIKGGDINTVGKIKKGIYTAPATIPSPATVTIKAISNANNDIFATASVEVIKEIALIASGIEPSIFFGQVTIGQEITQPIVRDFTITTNTGEAVGWQATSIPTWLRVSPHSGTTPDQVIIEVIDTSTLIPGFNEDTLIFQGSKKEVTPLTLNVSINATSGF